MFDDGDLIRPERRQAEASRIREKYPDRIPVGSLVHVLTTFFGKYCIENYTVLNYFLSIPR